MGGKSKSPSPPPLPAPSATPTDMSPEVSAARKRSRDIANKMQGYQSTLLTGPRGLGGGSDPEKRQLLGG